MRKCRYNSRKMKLLNILFAFYLFIIVDASTFVALEHVFPAVCTDSGIGWDRGGTPGTLERLGGGVDILKEVYVLDLEVAGDDGQRELDFDVGLAGLDRNLLGLVPRGRLVVLKLDHGLDGAVVVADVDGPDHLLPLQVPDPQVNLADAMARAQFDDVGRRRVFGVHLQRRELQRGEGNLGAVADKAGVGLQVEAVEVHQLAQAAVDVGVGMVRNDIVLGLEHGHRLL